MVRQLDCHFIWLSSFHYLSIQLRYCVVLFHLCCDLVRPGPSWSVPAGLHHQTLDGGMYEKVAEYFSILSRTELYTCSASQFSFGKIKEQAQTVSIKSNQNKVKTTTISNCSARNRAKDFVAILPLMFIIVALMTYWNCNCNCNFNCTVLCKCKCGVIIEFFVRPVSNRSVETTIWPVLSTPSPFSISISLMNSSLATMTPSLRYSQRRQITTRNRIHLVIPYLFVCSLVNGSIKGRSGARSDRWTGPKWPAIRVESRPRNQENTRINQNSTISSNDERQRFKGFVFFFFSNRLTV